MIEEPDKSLIRFGPWMNLWFWIGLALVLVIVFNIWPNLAVSPSNYPWAAVAFLAVMFLAGGFLWMRRKR